jgi:hypothetical protein
MPTVKTMQVSFILDETGSMETVRDATISGFNEYIKTLKKEKNAKSIRFTLTQFDSTHVTVLYDGVTLDKVEDRNYDNYKPGAMTPLYDAVARTIKALEGKVKGKKQSALVIIQTDGEENSSREYTHADVFKMIDEKKKLGWTFVFLGANQDRYIASQQFGIPIGNTMNYRYNQTQSAFANTARGTSNYVSGTGMSVGAQTNTFYDDQSFNVLPTDPKNLAIINPKPKKSKLKAKAK